MSIYARIKQWATERKIYEIQFDKMKQLGFLVEEAHEFITANDDNARIDALCDMAVFATNAIYTLDRDYQIDDTTYHIAGYKPETILGDIANDLLTTCQHIAQLFSANSKFLDEMMLSTFNDTIKLTRYCVEEMGYNWQTAMDETLKEIESRNGFFDPEKGKWIKTETTYKANYDLAKETNEPTHQHQRSVRTMQRYRITISRFQGKHAASQQLPF